MIWEKESLKIQLLQDKVKFEVVKWCKFLYCTHCKTKFFGIVWKPDLGRIPFETFQEDEYLE